MTLSLSVSLKPFQTCELSINLVVGVAIIVTVTWAPPPPPNACSRLDLAWMCSGIAETSPTATAGAAAKSSKSDAAVNESPNSESSKPAVSAVVANENSWPNEDGSVGANAANAGANETGASTSDDVEGVSNAMNDVVFSVDDGKAPSEPVASSADGAKASSSTEVVGAVVKLTGTSKAESNADEAAKDSAREKGSILALVGVF